MSRARPVPRRRSREAALQALYAADTGPHADLARAPDALAELARHFEVPRDAEGFARELIEGVLAARAELDARIEAASRNWRLARMTVVDRNVLRLAAFELSRGAPPPAVVIDEAIELARRYGDDASPRFVNGILGALLAKEPCA